jgi:hypothetical protein
MQRFMLFLLLVWLCAWWWPLPLRASPDPRLIAQWDSATSATIQWTQVARGCLSVAHRTGERVFLLCSERYPATIVIALGHGPTDGTARPQAGDVYILETNSEVWRASLRGRAVYLGVVRR